MKQSVKEFLIQKINSITKKNDLIWNSGITNAHIVLDNFYVFTSIDDLLFDPEIKFVNELDINAFNFNYNQCIKNKSYRDFVLSALLYSLKYELEKVTPDWIPLSIILSPALLREAPEGSLYEEFYYIITELDVFYIFKRECLDGLLCYMTYSLSDRAKLSLQTIQRILILFKFPHYFIKECLHNCKKEKTFGPLLLALYVESLKCDRKSVFRAVKWRNSPENTSQLKAVYLSNYVLAFNDFKKDLIQGKKLSKLFFFKLKFKNKKIKNFYTLNDDFDPVGLISFVPVFLIATTGIEGVNRISSFLTRPNLTINSMPSVLRKKYPFKSYSYSFNTPNAPSLLSSRPTR